MDDTATRIPHIGIAIVDNVNEHIGSTEQLPGLSRASTTSVARRSCPATRRVDLSSGTQLMDIEEFVETNENLGHCMEMNGAGGKDRLGVLTIRLSAPSCHRSLERMKSPDF